MSKYVVFEGQDGAGKSTLIDAVKTAIGSDAIAIAQPGGTPLGDLIRDLVKYPDRYNVQIDDYTRQAFYQLDNDITMRHIVLPALASGKCVLSDRCTHISSWIYGSSDGVSKDGLAAIRKIAPAVPIDMCFVLDLPATEGQARARSTRTQLDHYDSKPLSFYETLRERYLSLRLGSADAALDGILSGDNVIILDATKPTQQLCDEVMGHLISHKRRQAAEASSASSTDVVTLCARRTTNDAILPSRKRDTDAGWDIYASEDVTLMPGVSTIVQTGCVVAAPAGWYITIEGRSSLWSKGIFPNRGIIDSGFTGDLIVSLVNTTPTLYTVSKGDRIAQLLVHRHHPTVIAEVDEFPDEYIIRGDRGFGSTGR
jgi:dTMP kinase